MKRFLLFIMMISFLTVSCTVDKEARVIKKLEKTLEDYGGYETTTEIKIIMDDEESLYTIEESSTLESINLEIIKPKESQGINIRYEEDNIYLENSSISQSISLKSIKNLNKDLIIGEFFKNIHVLKSIEEEKLDGVHCYKIVCDLKEKNRYNNEKIIYLNKKDFKPLVMKILDENHKDRVIIKYDNFNFSIDENI